ncbi:MAG: 1-deoxy-D-xylulose-5-phosphate reductoisomerase [Deltaproteobacteria bacterium]|nr:MAG: 1-deoxy-D-xylulose-5-phosphate reductoisomerase [Deltaproteobacteria bacterium]
MKNIAVLGSTGSIGVNTLDIVRSFPDKFKIKSLCCKSNIEVLSEQIIEFKPDIVSVFDEETAGKLRKKISGRIKTEILWGDSGYKEAVSLDSIDMVVSAIVGSAGLKPTFEAIHKGKDIALANKESLVAAGDIVLEEALKRNVRIVPVDSEHSAIFQALEGHDKKELAKIFLTASGGPFRKLEKSEFKNITPEQAVNHPTWKMGAKISVDSATLMNKGLELIEAVYLFDLNPLSVEIVVHPQSIVHSMAGFFDGSIIAQMGLPDMREAISYALSWPKRLETGFGFPDFSFLDLHFEKPDYERFRSLGLAFSAAREKKTLPAAMNAANEEAVYAFLKKMIRFDQIPEIVEEVMLKHDNLKAESIGDVFLADEKSRIAASEIIKKWSNI